MRRLALLVAAAGLVLSAAPAQAAPVYVIRGDNRIGPYEVKRDGSLGGAIDAFGEPASRTRKQELLCLVRWPMDGLTITFYNLGGFDPCTRSGGRFSNAVITGGRFVTAKGLRIGSPLSELQRLYPGAERRSDPQYGTGWWLVERKTPFGLPGTYPGLLARTRGGEVTALVVRYPAGGD